jgi:hypothetical protein
MGNWVFGPWFQVMDLCVTVTLQIPFVEALREENSEFWSFGDRSITWSNNVYEKSK